MCLWWLSGSGRVRGSARGPRAAGGRAEDLVASNVVGRSILDDNNREIASALDISEKTVRNHASNIYKKLHIFDRTQAVIYAVRRGLVNLEQLDPS